GGTEDEHGPEAVRGAGAAHGALRRARAGDVSLLGAGARAIRVHAAAGAGDRAAAAPGVARVRPARCGLAQRQVGARGRRLAAGGPAFAMGAARAPHGRAARAAGGARFLCAARSAGGGPAHAPSPPGAGDRGFQRRRHAAAAPRHLRLVSQLPPDRPAADAVPVGPAVRGGAGARAGASVARTCPPRQLDLPPAPRLDAPGLGAGAAPAVGLGCDPRLAALVRPLLQRLLVPARAPQRVRGGCQLGAAHLRGQRRAGAHERQCDRQLPARAVLAGGRRTGAFDSRWREGVAASWKRVYEQTQGRRARLAALRAKCAPACLTVNEALELADLEEELGEGPARALTLRRELLAREPGSVPARFVLARQLLQQGDRDGVALMEAAMQGEADAVLPGCELLRDYWWGAGERERAVMERLRTAVEFPGETLIINIEGANSGLGRQFAEVAHARIV